MQINTSRFGQIDVAEDRVISFHRGVLGFPSYKRYVLIEAGQESCFWWLQSVDLPDLAFVVTDPSLFISTYKVPIREEQMLELKMDCLEEAQVFVIVNKREDMLTGNLQGPLVINVQKRIAEQLVLSDRRFNTRIPLLEVGTRVEAASA